MILTASLDVATVDASRGPLPAACAGAIKATDEDRTSVDSPRTVSVFHVLIMGPN